MPELTSLLPDGSVATVTNIRTVLFTYWTY